MSVTAPILVDFINVPTNNIGSTPEIIFQNEYTCDLDSVWVTNLVDKPIKVTIYILKEVDLQPQNTPIRTVSINAYDSVDVLKDSVWRIQYGDLLFAYTDFSSNKCSSFIAARAFRELGGLSNVRKR